MIIFIFLIIIILTYTIYTSIYNSCSHIKGDPKFLKEDAKIIDIKTKIVGPKQSSKLRTIVIFNDGFKYISHRTNREDHLLHYTLSITENQKKAIISEAKIAHGETLKKFQRTK